MRRMFGLVAGLAVMRLMDANDGGSGGGGGGGATPPAKKDPETFSREYVHELREENKSTRLKLQEAQNEAAKAKEAAEAAKTEAEGRITAAQTAANQRIIRAEVKALAIKEGLVDLDDIALIDISKITIEEDGSLKGASEALKAFKEAKPHKFGESSSSSSQQPPKKKDSDEPKKVKDMTPEEKKARARELGIK